jgi:hypothetical protein
VHHLVADVGDVSDLPGEFKVIERPVEEVEVLFFLENVSIGPEDQGIGVLLPAVRPQWEATYLADARRWRASAASMISRSGPFTGGMG